MASTCCSHRRRYSANISGKNRLNSSATPLPITPWRFTVFTSTWAGDSNNFPRTYVIDTQSLLALPSPSVPRAATDAVPTALRRRLDLGHVAAPPVATPLGRGQAL